MSRIVTCARCNRQRAHKAKGLCDSCYRMEHPSMRVCSICGQVKPIKGAQGTCDTCYKRHFVRRTPKLAPSTSWADKAACASIRDWNPRRSDGWPGMTEAEQAAVCATCPVAKQCRKYGTRDHYAEAVYGGQFINNRKDTAA